MDRDLRETPLFRAVDRRKGFITLSDHRWNRHRTRPVRLAYPVTPLAVSARLAPSPALRITPPRLAADLDAGLCAAGPGTVPVPAVARRADHNLSMVPVAGEQASRLTHPPLSRAG